jgi:hypothetical protein
VVQVEEQIRELQQRLEEIEKRGAGRAAPPAFVEVAECCVCLMEEREAAGLRCNAAVGFGHFLCTGCLQARRPHVTYAGDPALTAGVCVFVQGHVRAEIDADRIMQTRGVIRCPHRDGPDLRPCQSEPWEVRSPGRTSSKRSPSDSAIGSCKTLTPLCLATRPDRGSAAPTSARHAGSAL